MMFREIEGIRLYYERFDGSGTPTVLLHGWGASTDTMRGIYQFLTAQNRSAVMLDLPFFGQSASPPSSFGIRDYARVVALFLKSEGYGAVNLLGHSFGGRIALILCAEYGIGEKLIVTGGAGLKPKRSLAFKLKAFFYKLKKKLGFAPKKSVGSADYRALPDTMKPVFVRVVNTHLDGILKKINAPTLLIWGMLDRDTPLYMAKKMKKRIAESGLVTLDGAGHYAFLDRPHAFYAILNSFLNSE
jgi:pimeloyl-ACP methyl ester carboxylesterase